MVGDGLTIAFVKYVTNKRYFPAMLTIVIVKYTAIPNRHNTLKTYNSTTP